MRNAMLFCALLTLALPAAAGSISDFYVIPAAAHASGAGGTAWRTDLAIQNPQPAPLTVTLAVVESGEGEADNVFAVEPDGAAAIVVPAGGSRIVRDVLRSHRGRAETTGALLVGGDAPFAVSSRTYDASRPSGSVGESVQPATDDAGGGALYLPGLQSNAAARSNIGLLASASPGGNALVVEVALAGADGSALGARRFTIQPGVTTQVQFPVTSVAAAPFDTAGAVVRIVSGDGTALAYASVVDNATEDASFVAASSSTARGAARALSSLLVSARDR